MRILSILPIASIAVIFILNNPAMAQDPTVAYGYFTKYCAECHGPDTSEELGVAQAEDMIASNFSTGMLAKMQRDEMPRMDGWTQAKKDQWAVDKPNFISSLAKLLGQPVSKAKSAPAPRVPASN